MTEIDRALTHRRLLGAGVGDIGTWRTWLVVLKAAFGQPLDEDELEVFHAVAGERAPPEHRVRASIGSNQSSKRYTAVSATGCEESDFVVMLFMAWSPIRRSNAG